MPLSEGVQLQSILKQQPEVLGLLGGSPIPPYAAMDYRIDRLPGGAHDLSVQRTRAELLRGGWVAHFCFDTVQYLPGV